MARGESEIRGLHHIDRGYEKFTEKLKGLGVCVSRVKDENDFPNALNAAGGKLDT